MLIKIILKMKSINKNDYENLVDKTTIEIENFIKRNDPDTKTQ